MTHTKRFKGVIIKIQALLRNTEKLVLSHNATHIYYAETYTYAYISYVPCAGVFSLFQHTTKFVYFCIS